MRIRVFSWQLNWFAGLNSVHQKSDRGYLVPDNPSPVDYELRIIKIPNDPQWRETYSYLVGLLTFGYVWDKDSGDYEAATETAMYILNCFIGLGDETCMSGICEVIADCIENNENVEAALAAYLMNSGYTPNFRDIDNAMPIVTGTQMTGGILPDDFDCVDPKIMGVARGVVQEINQSTEDMFEVIELVTNSVELAQIITQYIPVVGVYVEFVAWLQNSLAEYYSASYTQAVEDEISCAIYCEVQGDCFLSLERLMLVYADIAESAFTLPTDYDARELLEWASSLVLTIDTATVAVFHWIVLAMMRFGGGMQGFVGISDLKSTIKSLAGREDYSYEDCDCAPAQTPTDYWKIYADLTLGTGAWTIQSPNGEQTPDGVTSVGTGSINQVVLRLLDLGAKFKCKAGGVLVQRRGSTGNGSTDFHDMKGYADPNISGSSGTIMNTSFITCNTNDCTTQKVVNVGYEPNSQSVQLVCRDGGKRDYPTNFLTVRKVVLYGFSNAGQVKPPMAVYVDSIPPVGEFFD